MYYLAAGLLWPLFPRYQHHRRLSLLETMPWLRSVARKWVYRFRERGTQTRLAGELSGQFFLVPLQVTTDSQVRVHSRFRSVHDFISNVVESFAHYASKESFLVINTTRWIAAFRTTDGYFVNWPRTTVSVIVCCMYMTSICQPCCRMRGPLS